MSTPEREGWPFCHVDQIRFGDLDAMGHLNNVEFLRFFETARIAFMQELFPGHDPTRPDQDFGLIFAECHIAYRSPGFFDERICTWIRPATVRRSSFRVEFEMRTDGDNRLLAEGWGALVGYDYPAGRAMVLPDDLRGRLAAFGATVETVSEP